MNTVVWTIIFVYFAIGAILIGWINVRQKDRVSAPKRWVKYGLYGGIVSLIVSAIQVPLLWKSLVIMIVLIAGSELIHVGRKKWKVLIPGLILYSLFGVGFYHYSQVFREADLLLVYMLVFVFDGFSQLSGQLVGKHRFLPTISPNKTLEGAVGGLLLVNVTAILLMPYYPYSPIKMIFISIGIAVSAFLGDLSASWYKRLVNVKDYSQLIPGHGGFLDRFDSYIVAGAVYWLVEQFDSTFNL